MKSLSGFAAYLGRAGAALRAGRPRVDLTLLNATSVVNGITAREHGPGPSRRPPPAGPPGRADTRGTRGHVPAEVAGRFGPDRYKALVIDDQASLPAAAARARC